MPTKSMTYEIHSDTLRTYFHITPPMSNLQIAMVVTDYCKLGINENITLWCNCYLLEQSMKFEFAQKIIYNITLHLKSEFSRINIPKMDHVVIPNFPQDGTSKWGLIFHTEADLIYDEKLDPVMRKMEVARLIAPKIAYQWFSNSLSSAWSNFWLLDALATMFGEEAVAKSFNNSEILNLFIIQNQYESLHLDSHFDMNPVEFPSLSEINSLFSFPRYMKVGKNSITTSKDNITIHYIVYYMYACLCVCLWGFVISIRFSTIMSNNFWAKGEKLAGAYFCPNTSSYEFSNWMHYKHYPVISWERNTNYTGYVLSRSDNTSNIKWLVPIKLMEISLNVYYKTCLASHINFIEMKFPQSDRWMVNLEQAGYYRVKYDLKGWHAIANNLNSTAGKYENISVINRAKIVDDAFHLMMERQLDVSLFWNLTQFLSQETNYVVWYPMIKVFEYMSTIFPISKDGIKFIDIKAKFRELLDKPLMAIRLQKHVMENDFTESFEQEILKWSCTFKHIHCANKAKMALEYHLQNPEIEPLLLASHIQANGIRQLFPCWDEPHFKATFNISITHPRYYSALSNMPSKFMINDRHSDLVRTYFHITPPMSTLQVAIIVTDYRQLKINDNITLWCNCYLLEQSMKFEFAQKIIYNITLHLKSEFSRINIPKMDHVAIPNFLQDGTSKWGLIFHTEADLIYDEKLDSVMRKMEVARLIAPKIAYQWFSNSLSSDWSNFWLHDALATMFGEEAIAKSFNNSEILNLFIIRNQYESLHLDSHFNMNPVEIISLSEINSIFSFPRYMKGIIVLRMFQSAISDKVFRIKIRRYVSRQFSTIISYNFWIKTEKLAGKYKFCPHASSYEFANWIHYKHYPVISWERDTDYTGFVLSRSYSTSNITLLMPIKLKEISLNKNYKTCLGSHFNSIIITFPQSDCWIVNFGQAGYYRVKYDLKGWHAIANYLNSTPRKYKSISVINRAKIVDDAFHLMMERQLDVSLFWNLTQFLSQETNYVVWYPMIKVFEYMSTIFPFPEDEVKFIDIKAKFRELLDKPLMAILLKEHLMENDFTESFKQEILKWSCTLKHNQCAVKARNTLGHHLQNPEIEPVPSEWKHWTYCRGFILCYYAYYSTWFSARNTWLRKLDHDLLPFLACCETDWIITDHLTNLFVNRFTQNEREDVAVIRSYLNIFHSIVSKHANTYNVLQNILYNLEDIKPK
ncbi:Glutamyl aminopeptidase [Trachymyrmex cornetzi]|uniref:Glutamyl aminopeptidase n=1 Tax=Trachymyrmex cornetzi TaxID=471704 RepID=A0A195E3C7_9HYME|nr:Glutamyl aminopeptidase [Trachymyrmex cornetzi]